jgi:hypothetical protein
VAFIDNSPGGERRRKDFEFFIKLADFVVVHDYEKDNEEHIFPVLAGVKHKYVTRTYEPPTLVASNTMAIPKSLLCL